MSCHCIPNGNVTVSSTSIDGYQQQQAADIAIIREQMCNWAQPEYGDAGESWEKMLWKAALIAVATANTIAQISIMEKRYDIAKDYANIAEDRWNRFKDNYAPLERAMLNEAGNAKEYEPDYPGVRERGNSHNNSAFRWADEIMADLAKKYALCVDTSLLNDMDYAEAISRDDTINYNLRDEEFWSYIKSDQRWNRRTQILNLGRGIQQISASYAGAANDALAQLGGLLDSGAQGAMKLLGYLSTARETRYPAQFSSASPLTGQSSSLGTVLAMGPIAN